MKPEDRNKVAILDAIGFVSENHLESEALEIANKVGNIYMACLVLYAKISLTEEIVTVLKAAVEERRKAEEHLLKEKRAEVIASINKQSKARNKDMLI